MLLHILKLFYTCPTPAPSAHYTHLPSSGVLQKPVEGIVSTLQVKDNLPHLCLRERLVSGHALQGHDPLLHLDAPLKVLQEEVM